MKIKHKALQFISDNVVTLVDVEISNFDLIDEIGAIFPLPLVCYSIDCVLDTDIFIILEYDNPPTDKNKEFETNFKENLINVSRAECIYFEFGSITNMIFKLNAESDMYRDIMKFCKDIYNADFNKRIEWKKDRKKYFANTLINEIKRDIKQIEQNEGTIFNELDEYFQNKFISNFLFWLENGIVLDSRLDRDRGTFDFKFNYKCLTKLFIDIGIQDYAAYSANRLKIKYLTPIFKKCNMSIDRFNIDFCFSSNILYFEVRIECNEKSDLFKLLKYIKTAKLIR